MAVEKTLRAGFRRPVPFLVNGKPEVDAGHCAGREPASSGRSRRQQIGSSARRVLAE